MNNKPKKFNPLKNKKKILTKKQMSINERMSFELKRTWDRIGLTNIDPMSEEEVADLITEGRRNRWK
jgi:hypothetical protein